VYTPRMVHDQVVKDLFMNTYSKMKEKYGYWADI